MTYPGPRQTPKNPRDIRIQYAMPEPSTDDCNLRFMIPIAVQPHPRHELRLHSVSRGDGSKPLHPPPSSIHQHFRSVRPDPVQHAQLACC